ncbi:MAG: c-type cytochrome [Bacteroidetes bacterium]|nr:c-type cytochrome [Bacteroidota bacterium]
MNRFVSLSKNSLVLIICFCIGIYSCKDNDAVISDSPKQDFTLYNLEVGNFPPPTIAADNPLLVEGVKLGRMLFYEPLLSKDGSITCASCHQQKFAFSDTSRFSIGVRGLPGKRQAMAVFNMAWNTNEFFWDGRAHLLRHQSLKPIQDELEMDETLENVVAKLHNNQTYRDQFIRVFGSDEITPEKISLALEQFMNSIVSHQSKYDRFLKDSTVFNESEKRGFALFNLEYNAFFPENSGADCAHCHGGNNFENNQYTNNGLDGDAEIEDAGRKQVTGADADNGKFKIPSLRNIALTPPYMHDGRFATLEEVIDHYDHGLKKSQTIDPALENTRDSGLRLTEQDKKDLIAFLRTLTDEVFISDPKYSSPF